MGGSTGVMSFVADGPVAAAGDGGGGSVQEFTAQLAGIDRSVEALIDLYTVCDLNPRRNEPFSQQEPQRRLFHHPR